MLKRLFHAGRMLVESMENRVLVGTTAFLGIIVIVGWLAINEPGRMKAFERQITARAVERGAGIYVSACATCHGPEGRGIAGRAPALNNPQLFGHDFFPEITEEINRLQDELVNTDPAPSAGRIAEINARIEELTQQRLNDADFGRALLVGYDPQEPDRLKQVGWPSNLENFIRSAVISGRPVSINYWPQAMPTWGQSAGGPLRSDQIEDLVAYITNWDREWTLDDLRAISQFAVEPCNPADPTSGGCVGLPEGGGEGGGTIGANDPIGTNVEVILASLPNVTGDVEAGINLYNNVLGCAGCHVAGGGATAPALTGTFTRINETRLQDPALAGYTPEHYIVESIVNPAAYVAPNYAPIMPGTFGGQVTLQELANLLAYLESQTDPSPE